MKDDIYSDNVSPSLLVKHYDCQERKNLQRYNLSAVNKCEKSTSQAEHRKCLVKLYSRATSRETPALFCEIRIKHSQTFCQKENQIGSKISADRKFHGNTQEVIQ